MWSGEREKEKVALKKVLLENKKEENSVVAIWHIQLLLETLQKLTFFRYFVSYNGAREYNLKITILQTFTEIRRS